MKSISHDSTKEDNNQIPSHSASKIKSKDYQSLAKIKMSDAISIGQSKSLGRPVESSIEIEKNFLIYRVTFSESDKSTSEIKNDSGKGNFFDILILRNKVAQTNNKLFCCC